MHPLMMEVVIVPEQLKGRRKKETTGIIDTKFNGYSVLGINFFI